MSADALARALAATTPSTGPILRAGMVTAVDGGAGTVTLVPATGIDSTDAVTARYLSEVPPVPGRVAWYVAQGGDLIVLGALAPFAGPGAAVRRTTNLSLAVSGTYYDVTFDTTDHDAWGMFDRTNLDRIIIPVSGRYDIGGMVSFAADATGFREVLLLVNGATASVTRLPTAGAGSDTHFPVVVADIILNAGDYVQMRARQTSGAALNLLTLGTYSPRLSVSWKGHKIPTAAAGPELLTNPGFESGISTGWYTYPWATGGTWTDETASMHTGAHSLKGVLTGGTANAVNQTATVDVVPGQRYDVSTWVKGSATFAGSPTDGAGLWLLTGPDPDNCDYFTTGMTVATGVLTDKAVGTAWAQLATTVTIPAGCYYARLSLRAYSPTTKTVYFDDASMKKAAIA